MSIGTNFLLRLSEIYLEEAEDRDGVNDGFNIPLDSQARALVAKFKLPLAKRLVVFYVMCGIPGRYLNSEDSEDGINEAANLLRKRATVRKIFNSFYDSLAEVNGFSILTTEDKENNNELLEIEKKRGSNIQKLLETILVKLGLPDSLVSTSGPSAVGMGIYKTAEIIEQNSKLLQELHQLASRLGISASDVQAGIGENLIKETINLGINDDYTNAVLSLVSALGIPDSVLISRKPQLIQGLRKRKIELQNRTQIITMINRIQSLLSNNTLNTKQNINTEEEK